MLDPTVCRREIGTPTQLGMRWDCEIFSIQALPAPKPLTVALNSQGPELAESSTLSPSYLISEDKRCNVLDTSASTLDNSVVFTPLSAAPLCCATDARARPGVPQPGQTRPDHQGL